MNLNWKTTKGNQHLPLFACFSPDICGSDFHFHEYLKMFAFLQSMFISKAQVHKVNSIYFQSREKNAFPWCPGNTCPNWQAAECV